EQAERALALAQARFADVQDRLAETRTRVDAGLATPLELQSDALAVTRAQLELRSASLNVLGTTLDLYELYALPLGTAPDAPAPCADPSSPSSPTPTPSTSRRRGAACRPGRTRSPRAWS